MGSAPCRALPMPTPEVARADLLGGCATTCPLGLQVGRSYIKQAGDPPGLCLPAVQIFFQLGCVANLQCWTRCGNRWGWPVARAIHSFIRGWGRQNAACSMLRIYTPGMYNCSKSCSFQYLMRLPCQPEALVVLMVIGTPGASVTSPVQQPHTPT